MEFIAHRAGNSPKDVLAAEDVTNIIEADVHLGDAGRVEVRHAKKLWFTRRLWDRWYLLPRQTNVATLREVMNAANPTTHLWLDLKGFTPRLSRRCLAEVGDRRPLTVSTKPWWLLVPFEPLDDVRRIRSAGNRAELALLLWAPSRAKTNGAVVHHRLLSDRIVQRLLRRGLLFTWAVHDTESIERLERLGVTGVILDDLRLVPD